MTQISAAPLPECSVGQCHRPCHKAPGDVDDSPFCLLHSKDPGKRKGPLRQAFLDEFERSLVAARGGVANFDDVVFPKMDLSDRLFESSLSFVHATFVEQADFSRAVFAQEMCVTSTEFLGRANFSGAMFKGTASVSAKFRAKSEFNGTTFEQEANFLDTTFEETSFLGTEFYKRADFELSEFHDQSSFNGSVFHDDAVFEVTTFNGYACFYGAKFEANAGFSGARFKNTADFRNIEVQQKADFTNAKFEQTVIYEKTRFHGVATWIEAEFLGAAKFTELQFVPGRADDPTAVFLRAHFLHPELIKFHDADLSRVSFHDCDVSKVWFTASVSWSPTPKHRAQIFEETSSPQNARLLGLIKNGGRDYKAIAQIYQQLKQNYDGRLDYWSADQFHFGEMEMQRLNLPSDGRLLRFRRWWYPRFGLVALYRWASDYGNSYSKPMWWMLVVLLIFAIIYPIPGVGLQHSEPRYVETYLSVGKAATVVRQRVPWELGLLLKSVLTSVDTATFQKSAEYFPAYPWGRAFAIAETLSTSTLFALFLLAIRRQFRR